MSTKKIYLKDESFDPIYKEVSSGFYTRTKILPSFLLLSGFFVLISQVLLPILVFSTQSDSSDLVNNATVVGRAAGFYDFEFAELDYVEKDYIPRKNFSQNIKGVATEKNVPEFFYISIPKLKIKNAKVKVNAKTLKPDKALGHYPNTALPGQPGNSFIFGHSVLPWFFNPKNYKTIFSTLNKLEIGDTYSVNYNNKTLTYVVESKEELFPKDVNPLAEVKPSYLNESTMVLMTCSPAGTKLKRLLINATLVN